MNDVVKRLDGTKPRLVRSKGHGANMALTLEQYATWLDGRDLPWPAPPPVDVPKVRPHVVHMPDVRAVLWNVYGTLIAIPPAGELLFVHPNEFVQTAAL